jgi:DNA helicase-2/ATP-dependent DNA helicase PcrA
VHAAPAHSVKEELNDPQAEAVAHAHGPLLVFAGAGSGKTRVITYRVANLVANWRVAPYRILAVTFTNKAAREMRERLGRLMGEDLARELWVGTFHATCARILRRWGETVGAPRNFVIYDSQDQRAVVKRVLSELNLDEKRYPPRAVLHRILSEKQEGRGPDDMAKDSYLDDAVEKVFRRYDAYLRGAQAVDFEDLIGLTVKLLEGRSQDARDVIERFSHVLVDEFQDTNAMQYRLLRALAAGHKNLCVVGDDDQSIYRWRGADVRNIRGFTRDFPDARVVKLEQNYRSTKHIVGAALSVIAPSRERVPKELWTDNAPGDPIDVIAAANERDEAALVTRLALEARESGVAPGDIAVFYRVHAQSRVLEESLRAANVPYHIVGGTKFYERAEIKDALAYLRVLVNPKSDVDLLRVVNVPARGIGQTTVDRLVAFASRERLSMHDALWRLDEIEELGPAPRKKLTAFRELILRLTKAAAQHAPHELLEEVLAETGYRDVLKAEKSAEADARLENLAELASSLSDYAVEAEAEGLEATLEGFLERVSLVADADADDGAEGGRVTLMTVHAAKGLEFEVVLLTGMEEDVFPYKSAEGAGAEEIEEERRLAYVAITRARKRLVVSWARTRQIFGTVRAGGASRFLGDLPKEGVVQRATAQAQSFESFVQRPSGFGWDPASGRGERPRFGTGGVRHPMHRSDDDAPMSVSPPSNVAPSMRWRAPHAERPAPPADEGRYVDEDFFDDAPEHDEAPQQLRKGSRVWHEKFGEGDVLSVQTGGGEPAVVAYFPGWGQRKVLARFLRAR